MAADRREDLREGLGRGQRRAARRAVHPDRQHPAHAGALRVGDQVRIAPGAVIEMGVGVDHWMVDSMARAAIYPCLGKSGSSAWTLAPPGAAPKRADPSDVSGWPRAASAFSVLAGM